MGYSNVIDINEGNIKEACNRLNRVIQRVKRLEQNISFRAKNQNYKNVNRIFNNSNDFSWKLEKNKSYLYTMLQYVNNIDNSLIYYYSWGTSPIDAIFTFSNFGSTFGKVVTIGDIKLSDIVKAYKDFNNILKEDYGKISGICKSTKTVMSWATKIYTASMVYVNKHKIILNNNKANIAHKLYKYGKKATAKSIKGVSKGFLGRFTANIKENIKKGFKSLKLSEATNKVQKVGVIAQWAEIALDGVINFEKNKKEHRRN